LKRPTRLTLLLLALGVPIAAVVALGSGLVNFAATESPSSLERTLAPLLRDASIRARAPKNVSAPSDPATVVRGRTEFRKNCLVCHGLVDGPRTSIAAGLNPPVVELAEPATQARTDGELFYIVSSGIRLTGMPSFLRSEPENLRWAIVALVRRLPQLTDEDRRELLNAN